MNVGSKITLVNGARLRRISEDGKSMLDKRMHEGALVETDTLAKILGIVDSADKKTRTYVVEVSINNSKLMGWVYHYEIAPGNTVG